MSANAVHRFVIEPAGADPDATAVIDAASGRLTSRAEVVAERVAGELARLGYPGTPNEQETRP